MTSSYTPALAYPVLTPLYDLTLELFGFRARFENGNRAAGSRHPIAGVVAFGRTAKEAGRWACLRDDVGRRLLLVEKGQPPNRRF